MGKPVEYRHQGPLTKGRGFQDECYCTLNSAPPDDLIANACSLLTLNREAAARCYLGGCIMTITPNRIPSNRSSE